LIHHRGLSRPQYRSVLGPARLLQAGLLFSLSVGLYSERARAESMDFALERLVENADECRTADGHAVPGVSCQPDDDAFMKLINQYGMALAPTSMYPARTTGYGGFEILVEGAYTTINSDADYMKAGTRGPTDEVTGVASSSNPSPPSLLQVYSLRLRKGFGFGVETGLTFGFMPKTSMIVGGLDLRIALFEGFRDGIPGFFPDLAVTGSVRTITGTPQVQLTVAGVSGILSKPITIAETGVLTPWAGYQHLFIFGDSGVIDFTPGESAVQACGLVGPNIPGTEGHEGGDGSPVCSPGGTVSDFNNNQTFAPVRLMRQRLLFGLNYRYEILTVGGQVMADVFNSARTINSDEEEAVFAGEKSDGGNISNFAFALQVGAQF
jgi:hypothetical protein